MLLICLPCVALDQWSKSLATAHLANKPGGMSFFGGTFLLQYARNPGAWGGLGDSLPEATRKLVFTLGVGFFLAILAWYILKQVHPQMVTVALSLILAGGIGNLIDRALYGYVVDFMYIGIQSISWMHTNIFNVADMAIMAGGGLLLVHALLPRNRSDQPPPDAPDDKVPADPDAA